MSVSTFNNVLQRIHTLWYHLKGIFYRLELEEKERKKDKNMSIVGVSLVDNGMGPVRQTCDELCCA